MPTKSSGTRAGRLSFYVRSCPNTTFAHERISQYLTLEEREELWKMCSKLMDVLDQRWAQDLPFTNVFAAIGTSLPEEPPKTKSKPKKLTSEK
jgi:hypothetical protein